MHDDDWIVGQASGVAVDAADHVRIVQRPRGLGEDEAGDEAARLLRDASSKAGGSPVGLPQLMPDAASPSERPPVPIDG